MSKHCYVKSKTFQYDGVKAKAGERGTNTRSVMVHPLVMSVTRGLVMVSRYHVMDLIIEDDDYHHYQWLMMG